MNTGFVHSVKVPRLYKESAKTVQKVLAEGASFKSLVFKQNHPNVQGIYALVSETLHHAKELQILIDESNILVENPRFDPWLARVLITELLWGKKVLKSEAKPIVTLLNYKEKLQELMQNLDATVDPSDKKTVKLPRYVRINTLLTSIDEALGAFYDDGWILIPRCDNYSSHLEKIENLEGDYFIQDFHIPEVLIFPPGTKFYDHPGYLNGKLLLQNKSSCLSSFLLNPKPGCEILDMCAAPGMKTTHLAAIINNTGKIYAVEMNESRYKTLCEFVTQTNATCVETIHADVLTISPDQYPNVKYILVDPSCSGSGMVERIDTKTVENSSSFIRLKKLQNLQSMILRHALVRFPNVKKVIYSTCSIYPEENECVVEDVMRTVGDKFKVVNLRKKLNNEWHNVGSTEYSDFGDRCLYALPEKDFCSGFFVAMFKRISKKSDIDTSLDNTTQDDNTEASIKEEKLKVGINEAIKTCEIINNSDQNSSNKTKRKKSKTNNILETSQTEVKTENDETFEIKNSTEQYHSDILSTQEKENKDVPEEPVMQSKKEKRKKRKKDGCDVKMEEQ